MTLRAPHPAANGFTLIEAMLILAVLAIVLGIGVPSFRGLVRDNRLREGARGLALNFQTARLKAIAANRRCYLDFAAGALAPADSFYTIWLDTDGDQALDEGETDSTRLFPPDLRGGTKGYRLPPGVRLGVSGVGAGPGGAAIPADGVNFGGSDRVWFTPRGAGIAGAVYLTGDGGGRFAVTVSQLGAVRLWQWEAGQWR